MQEMASMETSNQRRILETIELAHSSDKAAKKEDGEESADHNVKYCSAQRIIKTVFIYIVLVALVSETKSVIILVKGYLYE